MVYRINYEKRVHFLFIISFLLFFESAARNDYPRTKFYFKLYTQEKIYVLSLCWSEIKFNFANMDRIGFDIDSPYRVTLNRVLRTDNHVDFYHELDSFFAAFRDGHTEYMQEKLRQIDYFEDIPAEISEIKSKVLFHLDQKKEQVSTPCCSEPKL